MATRTPPWKRKRPAGPRRPLTEAQRRWAEESARAHGRPYPNLVDNMAAARRNPDGTARTPSD